ncbi:MAG: GGDEF domain-containing protein, partial [Alcaligenaceae bacterium]
MKHPPFSDRPPAGDSLLFLFVAVVSCTITYFVNVHYGLVEQRQYALDVAQSILTDPHDSGFSTTHLESVLHVHDDVKELSFCHAGRCQTVGSSQSEMGHCGTGTFPKLLCVVATDKADASKSVSVKVHPEDTYHDAYRDVAVVLFAQVLGMMAWYGVTRGSRRRLRQAGEALHKAAAQDFLTGLANRFTMDAAINQALEQKLPDSWLLYLDIDDFKLINDAHGHEVGDSVLRSVARRLALDSPADFLTARMGGDEFAILLTNKPHVAVEIILEELMSAMGHPIEVDGRDFLTSISIGVSPLKADGCTLPEAKRRADIALYESKRLGKGRASFNTKPIS